MKRKRSKMFSSPRGEQGIWTIVLCDWGRLNAISVPSRGIKVSERWIFGHYDLWPNVSVPLRGLRYLNYRSWWYGLQTQAVSVPSRGLRYLNGFSGLYMVNPVLVSVPSRGLRYLNEKVNAKIAAWKVSVPSRGLRYLNSSRRTILNTIIGFPSPHGD